MRVRIAPYLNQIIRRPTYKPANIFRVHQSQDSIQIDIAFQLLIQPEHLHDLLKQTTYGTSVKLDQIKWDHKQNVETTPAALPFQD